MLTYTMRQTEHSIVEQSWDLYMGTDYLRIADAARGLAIQISRTGGIPGARIEEIRPDEQQMGAFHIYSHPDRQYRGPNLVTIEVVCNDIAGHWQAESERLAKIAEESQWMRDDAARLVAQLWLPS